jgi:phospholipase/carboxylesterase
MNEQTATAERRAAGPHQGQRVVEAGAPLAGASAAVVLVHGRGATAESILQLAGEFARPDVAFVAPQAAGNTWYPYSFLAPLERNEPGLSSGLQAVADALARVEAAGVPAERAVVLGFSQGACLAMEFVARNARRYGGAVALCGGLIGTGPAGGAPPFDKSFDYAGSLHKTPVFLGCSDADAHIPLDRVLRTAEVMRALGGVVTDRIYPGMGHTVNEDELLFVRGLLAAVVSHA